MKALKLILLCVSMMCFVSCDDEDTFDVTPQTLSQTVWNVERVIYDEDDNEIGTRSFIIEFLKETEGKCSDTEINQVDLFTYFVDKSIININSPAYSILVSGSWHIIEKSEKRIVLQGYFPKKYVMTLSKIL